MRTLYLIFAALTLMTVACNNTDPNPGDPIGEYKNRSDCKYNDIKLMAEGFDSTRECIQYKYVDNTLMITHVNAGLNCCPEPMNATVTVKDGVITIDETRAANNCKCLCLYDVNYTVNELPAGTYIIEAKSMTDLAGDDELKGTVDLVKNPEGSFCVARTHYPWGL